MAPTRTRVLYVTDLAYQAQGRRYCDEDIFLASRLREDFDVALCHPLEAAALMQSFDLILVRNSGPVLHYQAQHDHFRDRAVAADVRVYSQLTGKADMAGKQYLLDLCAAGYPVIPTIDSLMDLDRLPQVDHYVTKPKYGADSVGLEFLDRDQLADRTYNDVLIQPRIDFAYEVSFYFIDWNDIKHGIQRIDACRTQEGELLLVELEDLNPYLSLDTVPLATREAFVENIEDLPASAGQRCPPLGRRSADQVPDGVTCG